MQDRPVKGTTTWKRCEIVLEVPDSSREIAFGLLLHGTGLVWMDDLKFETVGRDVPLTSAGSDEVRNAAPQNLDFEE